MVNNILISTDCVADLPKELLKTPDLSVIYFEIETESGLFRDTVEINSQNVMEYMMDGKKKAHSVVPNPNEYKNYFMSRLKEYDEIIHICMADGSSLSYGNACLAVVKMGVEGKKVHVIDSKSLSGGQALLIVEAINSRKYGMSTADIVKHLNVYKETICCSFLAYSADYLYYNGKVSKGVMNLCRAFKLHPVLKMVDGKMKLDGIYIGNYQKAAKKYIKKVLGNGSQVNKTLGFLVHAGCDQKTLNIVRKETSKRVEFKKLYENTASATVSSNCGPYTFGVLYVKEGK